MELVEAGVIVNTHSVHGAVKIEPWTDTPEFLCTFDRLFIDAREFKVIRSGVHKNHVLTSFEHVVNLQDALSLRGKKVSIAKEDAGLPEGEYFIDDLIGLDAIDEDTGGRFGVIKDFIALPSNGVYVIDMDDTNRDDMLIPAVPEFVRKIDAANGCVRFHLMEGL